MESTTSELRTVACLRREGLEAFVQRFNLLSVRHAAFPSLVLLKYNQVESPFDAEEVQECRGLILDEAEEWRPVAMPFLKFFNYGESNGAAIDWSRPVRVMDKVDGSLSTLYFYKGEWYVSSSGRPDGGGVVYRTDRSDPKRKLFRELFWQIWKAMKYPLPDEEHQHYCFMFELFSAENQIIVNPKEEMIVFTGVRNMRTLQEEDPVLFAQRYGWRMPQMFEYGSLEEVLDAAKRLNPSDREGFVVCDHQFNRVKVKSPQYVAVAHLTRRDRDGLNKRRMLDIVKHNEGSEFLAYFPQWAPLFTQVKERYDELCNGAEKAWAEVKDIEDERAFAKECSKHKKLNDYLWLRRKGRAGTARTFYEKLPEKKLEQLLPRWDSIKNSTPVLQTNPTITSGGASAAVSIEQAVAAIQLDDTEEEVRCEE